MTDLTRRIAALTPEQRQALVARLRSGAGAPGDQQIPRRAGGPARASFAQERMWFLHRLHPESDAYNGSTALHLRGPLDAKALERSLAAIVNRHEVLRSTFEDRDGELWQVPGEAAGFRVRTIDVSDVPEPDRGQTVRQCLGEEARRPFDLGRDLLLRAVVVRLQTDEHVLLLTAHHIASDGWSVEPLVRELSAGYAAFRAGRVPALADLPIQYGDFATWERGHLRGEAFERDVEYWRQRLAALDPLPLPTDRARPAVASQVGAPARRTLSRELSTGLRDAARGMNATLFMVMLAAFKALLHRHAGATDVAVGLPMANRGRRELEPLIGFFANLVVLRTRVTGSQTFRQLVDGVREAALGAFDHQHVPFDRLVDELGGSRDLARNPLAQVTFVVQQPAFESLRLQDLAVREIDLQERTTRFDIECHAWDRADGIELVVTYSPDLFEASTIGRLLDRYERLLAAAIAAPETRVDALPLLQPDERRKTLVDWNPPSAPYPRDASLAALFEAQAAMRSPVVALECGGVTLTYGDLDRRANQIARALRGAGVRVDAPVGVLLPRGIDLVVTLVGVLKAGGAYLAMSPDDPPARLALLLADAAASVVVSNGPVPAGLASGRTVVDLRATSGEEESSLHLEIPAEALAYVAFTSGSTGRPKGVAVVQRAVARLVFGADYISLGPDETLLQLAPVSFDASTLEIWGALLRGGRLVIHPDRVTDPVELGALLARTGVTTAWLTSSLYNSLIDQAPAALAPVRQLLIGGEALSVAHVRRGLAQLPATTIVNGYGPTENTTFTCCHRIPRTLAADAASVPLGGPIAHTRVYVLDEAGGPAPIGVPGELLVGGDGLARGYVGGARATAERFVPDAVSGASGARLYRTGDIVRWRADGTLEFCGRRDGQVKLRGYRIELGEVEAALRAAPGVRTAAAVVSGSGETRRLVGYVTPVAGGALVPSAVRQALRERVPSYLVPPEVVVLDELPLNENGKVDRRALPAPASAGAPAGTTPAPARTGRSGVAAQIAEVWADVLGRPVPSHDDNFFDLGGHSLRLMRVQAGLESALGRHVPLVALFQYPTVAALAASLEGDGPDPTPRPVAGGRTVGDERAAGDEAIAIIGMAGRFPGAPDVTTWWNRLRSGDDLLHRFTEAELEAAGVPAALRRHPRYVPVRGVLNDVDRFDADLFGYSPREAAQLDPQQRLLLECVWTALETAGCSPRGPDLRVGVYAGSSLNTYSPQPMGHEAVSSPDAFEWMLASSKDFLATRVSYKLRLTGPAITVQTACSTSLVAVHAACQALRSGDCELAVAGGVSVTVPDAGYLHHPDGIASPDGRCRPFDAQAAGTVAGNGVGVVVLKRLSKARADGDRVLALVRGTAVNNDGADKVGFTAPSVHGQAAVVAAAQRAAGVAAETIGYVEAHGTGTALGDPVEVAALRQVFGVGAGPATCGLGSVKGNVGHLDAAAGIAGLMKTVLALQHAEIPPTLHFTGPRPDVDLGPFFVPAVATPWPARRGTPRRAGVSSFGMGGTNVHVVIEEAPPSDRPPSTAAPASAWHVVPVSGHTPEAAAEAAGRLADSIEALDAASLADAAHTVQTGRAALAYRRVAVGRSGSELAAALRRSETGRSASAPPLVWLFPGQGTAVRGQGAALYQAEPAFRSEIDACAALAAPMLGDDLASRLYGTDDEAPLDPVWTQVGLVAIELALAALWRARGLRPVAVLGHSVGELAAAAAAGAIDRDAAIGLAVRRARLMAAAPRGGMLAVAADRDALTPLLGDGVTLAAVNGPRQSVVAGSDAALSVVGEQFTSAGLVWQRLSTSGAFHSPLMSHVVEPLTIAARAFAHRPPECGWISSVTGAPLSEVGPDYWGRQVVAPVLWLDAMTCARREVGPAPVWLEVGPGHTLAHLARGVPGEAVVASLAEGDAAEAVARAVGQLWTAGCAPDWASLHAGRRPLRMALPTYPFQRRRFWLTTAGRAATRVTPADLAKDPDASRWFYAPAWHRAGLEAGPSSSDAPRRVLVFADRSGVGGEAAARLKARGCEVVSIVRAVEGDGWEADAPRVEPNDREGCRALIAGLVPRSGRVGVLHLWALDEPESPTGSGELFEALPGVLHVVQGMLSAGAPVSGCLVATSGAQDVTGEEPIDPRQASVHGLLRVVALEHPELRCRSIDVTRPIRDDDRRAIGRALADELLSGAADLSVALRGRRRWVADVVRRVLPPPAACPRLLTERGAYLVTGGLGRIGLALAGYLVRAAGARVILLGRGEPGAAAAARLREWREQGAEVHAAAGDVGGCRGLGRVLEDIDRRHGGLAGVVHAAGLTRGDTFAPVAMLTAGALAEQWRAKAGGALNLSSLLEVRMPVACVMMSSLSATLGGHGFGAYASANAVLDALAAAHARASDAPWLSIAWDGWSFAAVADGAGATADLALSPDEGIDAFARVLDASPLPHTIVSTADLHGRLSRWLAPVTESEPTLPDVREGAPHGRRLDTPFAAPAGETASALAAIWEEMLGVRPIGSHDDFFALGGHSLVGTQLMSRVRERFRVDLSLTALFEDPTVAGLSARIEGRRADLGREADPRFHLDRLRQLSADDRRRLLEEARRAEGRSR